MRAVSLLFVAQAHTLALTLALILALVAGCGEQIEVPNQPAVVAVTGLELTAAQLVDVRYTLSDAEGDDQELRVQICEAPGLTRCATPFQGQGSDGASFVNTAPRGEVVQHIFRWDIGCGRLGESGTIASELERPYVARVAVEGGEFVDSEQFTLAGLGVVALPPCTR